MIHLKRIWNSKVIQFVFVGYFVFSYFFMAISLVSMSVRSVAPESNGYVSFSLLGIFVFPFVIPELFGKDGNGVIWGQRLYNWIYIATVLVTVFSGIAWYTYARSNSYLEPVTYLLTLATAAIIYNRDKYLEAIKQSEKLQSELSS